MQIIDPDAHPSRTVYFIAAATLKSLNEEGDADLATVYTRVRQVHDVSRDTVALALDFLFLLGLVELADNGGVRCT